MIGVKERWNKCIRWFRSGIGDIEALPAWAQAPARFFYKTGRRAASYAADRMVYAGAESVRVEIAKHLRYGVQYVYEADVQGDVAEFGTMSGATAAVLAKTMSGFRKLHAISSDPRYRPKILHLFDSFKGFPDPETASEVDRDSPHVQTKVWERGTCYVFNQQELAATCEKFLPADSVKIYDGWFKDTLSRIPAGTKLALVHIDCDLYQSAKDVLDYCFSKGLIAAGAALFFDDWNCNQASPSFGERRAWAEAVERFSISSSDWGSYGWCGKKFIIHSYRDR